MKTRSLIAFVILLAALQCSALLRCNAADMVAKQNSARYSVLKTEAGTEFNMNKASGERFELTAGTVLIQPRETTLIQLKHCFVDARAGSVLLMSMNNDVGCVTNLCESADHSVSLKFGDCSLKLKAGSQAWFGPTESAVAAAVKQEPGRPTLIRQHQAAATGIIAEFSISPATMLDTSPIVQSLKESSQSQERKLYNRIIKTSAALTMVR